MKKKKKKKISPEERRQTLAFLREKYPQAFRQPGDIKAFEIGFRTNLLNALKNQQLPEGMKTKAIDSALAHYCANEEYKKAREVLGNPRINLTGEIVSQVTSEDKNIGKQLIRRQQRQRKSALKAEKQAKEEAKAKAATAKKQKTESEKTTKTNGKLPLTTGKKPILSKTKTVTKPSITTTTNSLPPKSPTKLPDKSSPKSPPTIIVKKRKLLK